MVSFLPDVDRFNMNLFPGLLLLVYCVLATATASAQLDDAPKAKFVLPDNQSRVQQIDAASQWLVDQVKHGTLEWNETSCEVDVIAWYDPTLEPGNFQLLAGYLQTDSVWAAKALQLRRPETATSLSATLTRLDAWDNGLQEVLFYPIPRIKHRVNDADRVHGTKIGTVTVGEQKKVEVRTFEFIEDPAFTVGHSRDFAEHTAYQALFEFWTGDHQAARRRLRHVFKPRATVTIDDPVYWDSGRQLLIDRGIFEEWQSEQVKTIGQFPIKLGTMLYAMRLTGTAKEFPDAVVALERRLWQCQLEESDSRPGFRDAGGVAHFIQVSADGQVRRGKGATGEATAIAILASTVQEFSGKVGD